MQLTPRNKSLMINMQPLGLHTKKKVLRKNRRSISLKLRCYNGSIMQWDIFCYWNLFSVFWYPEKKIFWNWICSCSACPPFHVKRRETELQCVIFRIAGNWLSRSKVRVIPSVDYHDNKSLLQVKWLNYSLPNVRSFISNLIYQSSLDLLNYFLPPVNGFHLSTAARTLMIYPLLFAAWCLTTNSHPFWYNDFWRKFYILMSLVYFIKMVNVLLMVIIFFVKKALNTTMIKYICRRKFKPAYGNWGKIKNVCHQYWEMKMFHKFIIRFPAIHSNRH